MRRCVCGGGGGGVTLSLPRCHLKTLSLFVFISFALACERIFIKTDSTESRCVIGPENILFLRHLRGSFSPEILQAGATKGLMISLGIFIGLFRETV